MGDVPLTMEDGTVVWLRAEAPAAADGPPGPVSGQPTAADGELELPDAFGSAQPVSVDGRMGRALTRGGEVLEEALRPLGGVLGQIHRSISAGSHRPDEVTVEFGVTLGSDLRLGVFTGNGEASFKVSATWNLAGDRGTGRNGDRAAHRDRDRGDDDGTGTPDTPTGPGTPGGAAP
ncbi:CU044_2847 family protein [Streptomyces bugieae]|uniref:CU044_2847 family protein n=1 Tax=Streptomyces bugieae TaxID=3098223 RepID=A0ABU7NTU1_9ACTN|nr:CU044_2847 family protein [Streptomyces sp. DSM 41528]